MIKSLLESEEEKPERIEIKPEEKSAADLADEKTFESYFAEIESPTVEASTPENLSEISEPADDAFILAEKPEAVRTSVQPPVESNAETFNFAAPYYAEPENSFAETAGERANNEPVAGFPFDETDNELLTESNIEKPAFNSVSNPVSETSNETARAESLVEAARETTIFESFAPTNAAKSQTDDSGLLFQTPVKPQSFAETARQSGLAYAAAVTLFGSIVFMLILGWFADLLLGSSPWGIVGGIVLGAAIGFFQFFRLTAQIFRNKD